MSTQPGRLGIREPLLARYAAAGWVAEGLLTGPASVLLAEIARGPDPGGARIRMAALLSSDPAMSTDLLADPDLGAAAVAIAGASRALSEVAITDPRSLRDAARGIVHPIEAVDPADDVPEAIVALRTGVRTALLAIAVGDLTGRLSMPEVGAALSETADTAAAAALAAAIRMVGTDIPMNVVAMGKWGGRELNYASDIDVLFVYEGGDEAGDAARRVAETFISLLDGRGNGAFRVDADLRPEGRGGPLARSLASYQAYWERWAETWELQALLKARPVAGDPDLGSAFLAAAEPFVFPETLGAEAVREIRSMKARTEQTTGTGGDIEIKRGVGGIRDVEFAAQLLQLVHGRSDPALRGANTLQALTVLGDGGYVRPEDAAELADAYRWLRNVEHRLQLFGLRQTHTLPSDPSRRERLAKAMGYRDDDTGTAAAAFDRDLIWRRATVRTIHERLFYRPLLEAFAASPAVRLTEQGAARQLGALGYADTAAARRAFSDLTGGLSRRSSLMQQMLPLMLDWLSEAPDPDLGLSQLRLLVTTTPDNAALIASLRDNPVIAERLCRLLGTSRLLGRLVDRIPASLARLGEGAGEAFPDPATLEAEAVRLVGVRADHDDRIAALRRFSQERLLWIAGADLMGAVDHESVGHRLTAVRDALAAAALEMAVGETAPDGGPVPAVAV
ncbi:MAG: bifunctional glutamine-synthetase adenylyltransferase/deadenyltransferase, partial [Acidimicrobiia bacterium]|nr:bifunctional glutamine-synthetase adenylyltransferase/deadenyltransferase [Acidimicrobiia bacterium]